MRTPTRPTAASTQGPGTTRRALLRTALQLGGTALLIAGCSRQSTAALRWRSRFLTVATTGGALRETLWAALFAPFERTTGCRVMDVTLPVNDLVQELRRQLLSGTPTWDVVVLDAPRLAAVCTETPHLFTQLDEQFAAVSGPFGGYGATIVADTVALACRAGPFAGRLPQTWAAAWDSTRAAFPGPRAYPRDPVGLLEIALLADGMPLDRLYPLDLPRAFRALDRLRPAIRLWWQQPDQAAAALTFGEADLLIATGVEVRAEIDSGAVAKVPPLPVPLLPLTLSLPRGAPNGDVARDFIAAALQAPAQTALTRAGFTKTDAVNPPGFPIDLGWWREYGTTTFTHFEDWLTQ